MKLYITDLDGTLINSKQEISGYTQNTIKQLMNEGIHFTIATARSRFSAWEYIEKLNIELPMIFNSGQSIYDPTTGMVIEEQNMDIPLCIKVLADHKKFGINPMVHTKIDGESVVYYHSITSKGSVFYMENRRRVNDNRFHQVTSYPIGENTLIGSIVTVDTKEKLDPLYQHLAQHYALELSYYKDVYTGDYWLEIMDRKATKGDAVEFLRKALNAEHITCFGDNYNDISMFKKANVSCAVENAVPELKDIATHIIHSNNDDGVVRYILEQSKGI
jgi:Cof subfamily protein (haloacid dehalogenase superfamily)